MTESDDRKDLANALPTTTTSDSPQRAIAERDDLTERIAYLEGVIRDAAYHLRLANVAHITACDLEDSIQWTLDPASCSHPYWNTLRDGGTVCRTCGVVTTDMEGMGT